MATVESGYFMGGDGGATKVTLADSKGGIRTYRSADFSSMDAVLDHDIAEVGGRVPDVIAIGMPGARDAKTGAITPTNNKNIQWSAFVPAETSKRLGTKAVTFNDMGVATKAVLEGKPADWKEVKPGEIEPEEVKITVAHSSGIGKGVATYDSRSGRFVIGKSEGGHRGLQPGTDWEAGYLSFLNVFYPRPSAELALSGLHGIDNIYNHSMLSDKQTRRATHLREAIGEARLDEQPVGAVLLDFADDNREGIDHHVARKLLAHMGAMTGSVLRDMVTDSFAQGGVFMTGSLALALYPYLVRPENSDLIKRFIGKGAPHADWLERVPIHLVINPHASALGSLALARDEAELQAKSFQID